MTKRFTAIALLIAALSVSQFPSFASSGTGTSTTYTSTGLPDLTQPPNTAPEAPISGAVVQTSQNTPLQAPLVVTPTSPLQAPSSITPQRDATNDMQQRLASAQRANRARALAITRQLAIPARGPISAAFGSRGLWTTRHTGIDIAASFGARVHAVKSGRVVASTYQPSYGNVVVVRGAGVDIWYAHLSKRGVRVGQSVRLDQSLGRVGCSGHCTGPHLHLEVRKNDLPTDPTVFLWGRHRGIPGLVPSWVRNGSIERLSSL